jgi:(2Fe-2S) ferredoxin
MLAADYVAPRDAARSLLANVVARWLRFRNVYVVVCRGPNCRAHGALPLRKRLVALLKHNQSVGLLGYACFGQCDFGPNVAFYPEGSFYGHMSRPDDADRVVRHATGQAPLSDPPLNPPEAERAEHLGNIAELVRTLEEDRARHRRWWWPF